MEEVQPIEDYDYKKEILLGWFWSSISPCQGAELLSHFDSGHAGEV